MKRVAKIALAAAVLMIAAGMPAAAQPYTVDSKSSQQLTDYLRKHRLPLVGAQVIEAGGGRQVMLYGYVATPLGKADAESKARKFLKQRELRVIDRIQVRPEIRDLKPGATPSEEDEARPEDPSQDPWAQILREIQQDRAITLPDDDRFGPP